MAGTPPHPNVDARPAEEPIPWTRAFPPLLVLIAAITAAAVFLPSALNLPQANPSTTLEYAPIPPHDANAAPVNGNFGVLAAGRSASIAPSPVTDRPPPAPQGLNSLRPNQKHCVGTPPRQTEDPASPPCVPFFEGDNFGSTYAGVTASTVNVLVYVDGGTYGSSAGDPGENTPANGTYVDIDKPRLPACSTGVTDTEPTQCDEVNVRVLKGFAKYFNDRYQTYGRHVHYWAYFSDSDTAALRRSDAAKNWERLRPFAVIDTAALHGYNDAYDSAMTQRGVLVFSSTRGSQPASFYTSNGPDAWGFFPDVQHWAALYSSYVCQKVVPFAVRRYGRPGLGNTANGRPRRFGLWYTTDPTQPGLQLFAKLVKQGLKDCNAAVVAESTFSHSGFAIDAEDDGSEASQAVARFEQNGVTTVLYIGGVESKFSSTADGLKYYPEIVVAGNLFTDNNAFGQAQNANVWRNAWAMTYQVRMNRVQDSPGYRAYKEGDPTGDDVAGFYAQIAYPDNFMLFNAIQLAGPRLTPRSVDQGFHAIPARTSRSPYVPALYFDPSDYTFVKDAAEEWWDAAGTPPTTVGPANRAGCWRMTRGGTRFTAGRWPSADEVFLHTSDPCTGFAGTVSYRAT